MDDGDSSCSDVAVADESIADDTMSAQEKNDMGRNLPPKVRINVEPPPPPRQIPAFYAEDDSVSSFDWEEIRLARLQRGDDEQEEDFDDFDSHEDEVESARMHFMELCSRVAWNDTTLTKFDACGRMDYYCHSCNNEDLVLLGESLVRNTNLQSLKIFIDSGNCSCRDDDSSQRLQGARAFRQGLAKSQLTTLILKSVCCERFQHILFQEPVPLSSTLQVLEYVGPYRRAVTTTRQFFTYPKLKELSFVDCTMENEDMQALSQYLATHQTLTSLRLKKVWHPSVSEETPSAADHACLLADGLRQNTSLVSLFVSNNKVGARGAQTLLQAATGHPSLQSLSLTSDPTIDFAGLLLIARELPHTKLKRLELDFTVSNWPQPETEIAHQAGQALLHAIQNSINLTHLSFFELDPMWMEPIRYRLALNETCGPLLLSSEGITPAVWPHILARFHCQDKIGHVYFSLKEQPLLLIR